MDLRERSAVRTKKARPVRSSSAVVSACTGGSHGRSDDAQHYTAIFERDGDWYVAYCPEVPGANGQGRTKDEARSTLASAIDLILTDRREDALRYIPDEAARETVIVG